MQREVLKVEKDFCIKLNYFLGSKKKLLFVDCKNLNNFRFLIDNMEKDDYRVTDIFSNVTKQEHLLFLIREQQNPDKHLNEYYHFVVTDRHYEGVFNLLPLGKQFVTVVNTIRNLFRSNEQSFKTQMLNILNRIGTNIAIMIYFNEDITQELKYTINELCSDDSFKSKFIIIYDGKNNQNKNLIQFANSSNRYHDKLKISYNTQQLKKFFPMLPVAKLQLLVQATNEDISEMLYIYNDCSEKINTEANKLESVIQEALRVKYSDESQKVLGIAAHLFRQFTAEDIQGIAQHASMAENYDTIKRILEDTYDKGLIDCTENEYWFLTEYIKKAFANLQSNYSITFHTAIAKYLAQMRPFDYRLRALHWGLAGNKKEEQNMIAMEFCNMCHFFKHDSNDITKRFSEAFNQDITTELLSIYENIRLGNYTAARYMYNLLRITDNEILQQEAIYLTTLFDWKDRNYDMVTYNNNQLSTITQNKDCEPEFVILAKMLELSIVSNSGSFNKNNAKTPFAIFNEIRKTIEKYNHIDALYLKNVLYRKSNSALTLGMAKYKVGESFDYFSDRKELYSSEYFRVCINYLAILIQSFDIQEYNTSTNKDTHYDPLKLANIIQQDISYSQSEIIQYYFLNNYLIAKFFCAPNELQEDEFTKLITDSEYLNLEDKTLLTMNVGTFFACLGKFDEARKLWLDALKMNDSQDDYFDYIIKSNIMVCDLCQGNSISDEVPAIPALFIKDSELYQYIKFRNKLIKDLAQDKQAQIANIQKTFLEKFSEKFNNGNLYLYSLPFLFSDVQFWSDN